MNKKGPRKRKPRKLNGCAFPEKEKYTQREALEVANRMYAVDKISVWPYKCPAGGHSHIGHKSAFSSRKG